MKNNSTSSALMVAMVSATTALKGPSSRVAAKTVSAVSTSSAAQTLTNVLTVGCACPFMFPLLPVVVMADQIEQREKIDPDQIDEVPVQPHHLHRRVVLRREAAAGIGDQQPG